MKILIVWHIGIKQGRQTVSYTHLFKIGRLIVCLNGFNPWYGTVQWNTESLSNIKRVFIYLGGPIFTISLSCVLWWLMKSNIFLYLSNYILQFMFISSVWQFIITMAPIKYTRLWDAYEGCLLYTSRCV